MKVSCGFNHTMAIDEFGKLWGWGNGNDGCLGLGDEKIRSKPQLLMLLDDCIVFDVACGDKFTAVIAKEKSKNNKAEIANRENLALKR